MIPLMGIRKFSVPALLAAALLLSGCSAVSSSEGSQVAAGLSADAPVGASLAELGIDTASARSIVDGLEALPLAERPADLMASVQPTQLVLQPGTSGELAVPFAEDDFYLSVAPFREQTHACSFHSLTTCVGEMQDESVSVSVVDAVTGEVVVDSEMRTEANGFLGLWLPAGRAFELTIEADGQTAQSTVDTGDKGLTCLTTMQLT